MLLEEAADHVVNCSMELGGNAPFLVFEDSDLDAAVDGAMVAKMRNGGESCIAANRFIVEDSVADEFSTKLAAAMGAMKVGPGSDRTSQVGPMINVRAVDDIASMVDSQRGRRRHASSSAAAAPTAPARTTRRRSCRA